MMLSTQPFDFESVSLENSKASTLEVSETAKRGSTLLELEEDA